jgi:hypothetical protein
MILHSGPDIVTLAVNVDFELELEHIEVLSEGYKCRLEQCQPHKSGLNF